MITDLDMPEPTGWNVPQWAERHHHPDALVLAVSGTYGDELDERWTKRFAGRLMKTVQRADLLRVVDELLGR